MQADHSRQMSVIQQKNSSEIADKEAKQKAEISFLKSVIARAAAWFPYFREMLRIENLCRLVGFSDGQPIGEWFKEQFDKLRQNIHRPIQPQRESRGAEAIAIYFTEKQ